MSELDDLHKKQAADAAEYNTYVAVAPIFHEGVRAHNEGDPVPVSNVKKYGYDRDGLVVKVKPAAAGSSEIKAG